MQRFCGLKRSTGQAAGFIVRGVTFPWVHHESAEFALDYAIAFLEAKLKPGIGLEAKTESS